MITTDDLNKTEEAPAPAPKKQEKAAFTPAPEPVKADNSPVTRQEFEALKTLFHKIEGDVAYMRRRVG